MCVVINHVIDWLKRLGRFTNRKGSVECLHFDQRENRLKAILNQMHLMETYSKIIIDAVNFPSI